MRINTAVRDYIKMFPEDYKAVLQQIEWQKHNLKEDFAEIKGHTLKRALFTIPEKMSIMFIKKLDENELVEFSKLDSARWFAKSYPQFAITKEI